MLKREIRTEPMFQEYTCKEAYDFAGIVGYEPMTAKEIAEEKIDEELAKCTNIIEEKFDGTRALTHFYRTVDVEGNVLGHTRTFSRTVSKKTGFYTEKSDSLPQIRDIDCPEMAGTVIDSELFINGKPFKEVASTMNCRYDKAIARQLEKGFVTAHAFDILFYKGLDLRNKPLEERKEYLAKVVDEVGSKYIEEVIYYYGGDLIETPSECLELSDIMKKAFSSDISIKAGMKRLVESKTVYPNLYNCIFNNPCEALGEVTPKDFYEAVVFSGGEGLMVKPVDGIYEHKRSKAFMKIKKFLTRDLIVMGFEEPTKEYTGKNLDKWGYWIKGEAVTKHYYNGQVGNLILGVLISSEDYIAIPEKKRGNLYKELGEVVTYEGKFIMEVCICSGFDDNTRDYFTRKRDKMFGRVIEVKANEIFSNTGALRHPRYLRRRYDKEAYQCTWKDHVASGD